MTPAQIYMESGEHFICLLEAVAPEKTITARKLIRNNLMKVEHDLQETPTAIEYIRPYGELGWDQRTSGLHTKPDGNGRIREWLEYAALTIHGSLSVFGLVMLLAVLSGGSL